MYKENFFLKILTYTPVVIIPFLIGIVLLITMQTYDENFNEKIKNTEKNILKMEKEILIDKINNFSNLVLYQKSTIKNKLTFRVKNRVDTAHKIATNIYKQYKGKKSSKEIKKMIITALRPFLWNNGESFIWIVDYNGVFQLAPKYLRHLEGSSIIDFQDATGRYVIKEEIAIVKNKKLGFLWDTFSKPNESTEKQYEQVAFVKALGHFNWYLGSAEYLDTATKQTNELLLETISQLDTVHAHPIFIINQQGDILVYKTFPEYVGKNISEINNETLKNTFKDILKTIKNKKQYSFVHKCINEKNKKLEDKFSYVKQAANDDWIIGSGFFLSEVEEKLSKEKTTMYEMFYTKSKHIIFLAVVATILSLFISFYLAKKLRKSFQKYEDNIESNSIELNKLNNTLMEKSQALTNLNESLELKVKERTHELETTKNELEILATTDALTKTHNRYSIMEILSKEISRATRYKTPLSVIMYDIDFFKKINDTYGHDIGDAILVSISELTQKNLREIDILGRYGGEEFIIILPNTSQEDAIYFANRLRTKVEREHFDATTKLTISLGVVQYRENESLDGIFKRVDDLLYRSKEEGRNRLSY